MRRPEVGLFALAMLAACTVPTEMPNWDVQWNLPVNVNGLGIDVSTLPLPSGVTIDSTSAVPAVRTGFNAQVSSLPAIVRTLGAQCADASCQSATNISSPKPAFIAPPATSNLTLAAGANLQTAALLPTSQLAIDVVNGFSFDPLNPPGNPANPGTITIAVNNGAATLGTLTLQGPGNTIPAGATRSFTIGLVGTINTASPITVTMTMDSPAGAAGQPVTLNRNQTFTVTPAATIKISSAVVAIAANAIAPSTDNMDLADLGEMALRVENTSDNRGAILLTVSNPMTLGANASLTFTGTKELEDGSSRAMNTITKNISLPAGGGASSTTIVTVPFTGVELREMLGSNMNVSFGGNTVAGTTAVTPTSKIATSARMRLRVFVKEIEQ